MKRSTLKLASLGLVTLALGLGAARFVPWSGVAAAVSGGSASGEPGQGANVEAPAAPAIPARQWREGDSFVYDLDTTRGAEISGDDQKQQLLDLHVTGRLTLTVIGKDAASIRLRADLAASQVEARGKEGGEWTNWLSRTFYVTARPSGEIEDLHFAKDTPAPARALLEGVLLSFQVIAPKSPRADWHVLEEDVTGQYRAAYHAEDATTIVKTKTAYVRTKGVGGLAPLRKDMRYGVDSATRFTLDASGWPSAVEEHETLDITAQGAHVTGTVATTAHLRNIESRPEQIGPFPAGLESESETEATSIERSKKQADANLVGGRTLAQITKELGSAQSKQRNQAQGRLAALLRVDPSQAAGVAANVLHGEGDRNQKLHEIGALGDAGTPEAQRELAKLLRSEETGDLRMNAAIALGLSKGATEETADALAEAARSPDKKVAGTSILAEGNVVRTMNNAHSGDTGAALQGLVSGLAAASTDEERKVYLEALGNTGDPRAFDAIAPYLTDANAILRATATGALRFMTSSAADAALAKAFGDADLLVRKAAVHTLPFRPIAGVLAAVTGLLEIEPELGIRIEIVKGLSIQIAEDEDVTATVEWAAENDPSAQIRQQAQQILDNRAAAEEAESNGG
ncbi:MAG: HEAT repeat domain-containing protein [Polyangiaceae bacterium]